MGFTASCLIGFNRIDSKAPEMMLLLKVYLLFILGSFTCLASSGENKRRHEKSSYTLIGGILDIGRGNLDPKKTIFVRPFEYYLSRMRKMIDLLRGDAKVLFVDVNYYSQFKDFVESNLTVVEQNKVILHPFSKNKLEKWEYFNRTQEIFYSKKRISAITLGKNSPPADLPYYGPLTLYKMELMKAVIASNPFGSDNFYWVDSGGCWEEIHYQADFKYLESITSGINPKWYMTKFMLDYRDVHGFDPAIFQEEVGHKPMWSIPRAHLFGGSREAFHIIYDLFMEVLIRTLKKGALGTEETILAIVFAHHANLWIFPEVDAYHGSTLCEGCPAWACMSPLFYSNCTYLTSNRVTMNWRPMSSEVIKTKKKESSKHSKTFGIF